MEIRHYFNCEEEALKFVEKCGVTKYHFETPVEYDDGIDLVIDEPYKKERRNETNN